MTNLLWRYTIDSEYIIFPLHRGTPQKAYLKNIFSITFVVILQWNFEVANSCKWLHSPRSSPRTNLVAWHFDKVQSWSWAFLVTGCQVGLLCLQTERGICLYLHWDGWSFQTEPDYLGRVDGQHFLFSIFLLFWFSYF